MNNLNERLSSISEKSKGTLPSTGDMHMYHYSDEARNAELPHDTMYNFLLERNRKYMNQVAIVFGNLKITYEELHENIDKYARALYKKGVREGTVVALGVANTPEALYLAYALDKIGAVVTPINPTYNKYKMKRDLEITKPSMYIGIDDCTKTFKSASKGMNIDIYTFRATESFNNRTLNTLYDIRNFLKGNASLSEKQKLMKLIEDGRNYPNAVYQSYKEGKLSDIMFTGGSSGVHKGVDLEENGINCVVKSLDYSLCLEPGEVFMGNLPQFIAFGKLVMHYALSKSLKIDMTLKAYPEDFVSELLRIRPAGAMGGPIHWEQLIRNSQLKGNCLDSLKEAISGGEQLKKGSEIAINEELLSHGAKTSLWNGLGMTEMWAPVAVKRGNLNTTGTVGVMLPFNKAKIMNPSSGKECDYNEEGLLYVTGPGMMKGYHNNEEETNKVISVDKDGTRWYLTGDVVKMKPDGEIIYVGRSKRIFVCGCDNVYPEQLETLISELPEVCEVVITKVPDEHLQYVPKAHIYLKNNDSKNENQVIRKIEKRISSTLGDAIIPRYYRFYDKNFPRTDSNKINFKKVEEDDTEINENKKVLVKH